MAITFTYTFVAGTRALASQVNSNFSTVATYAMDKTGDTMTGDLKFTDALYDIGKSAATRPRDFFLSRNATIGGTLNVTGVATLAASTIALRGVTYTLPSADGAASTFLQTNGSAVLSWASNLTLASTGVLTHTGDSTAAIFVSTNANANPLGWRMIYSTAAPNGTGNSFLVCGDSATDRFQLRSNGGLANFSGNNVNLSDAAAKDIYGPAEDELASFMKLQFVRAQYKDSDLPPDVMLTAQNVQGVYPEQVTEFNGYLGVREHGIIMRGMKVIEELAVRVAALEGA